jgi:Ca-activated chloride channel family protein
VSFAWPFMLVGLAAIPVLIAWYGRQGRRRAAAAAAFSQPQLMPSSTPRRPRWRRHVPMLVFLIAIVLLIVAAARPQRTVAVPIDSAAIMLANDVSSSMTATDVKPSRLAAARRAAERFVAALPASALVGQLEFARNPRVLQSPTTDHSLTQAAIASLRPGGGGTAIGESIQVALDLLTSLRQNGKRPPGAIILLSDGASNVGVDPLVAARQAKSDHIPVYTIAIGTPNGTIPIKRGQRTVTTPVPVSSQQLAAIAAASGGRTFTAADSAKASAVYAHLAALLGHKKVKREMTASVAGGGLVLLLIGCGLSLWWFARLA